MITAETVYRKARQLDSFSLQEVSDFMDFLLAKLVAADNQPEKNRLLRRSPTHPADLRNVLDAVWGAWGNKSADEVDREIERRRADDWEREWSNRQ